MSLRDFQFNIPKNHETFSLVSFNFSPTRNMWWPVSQIMRYNDWHDDDRMSDLTWWCHTVTFCRTRHYLQILTTNGRYVSRLFCFWQFVSKVFQKSSKVFWGCFKVSRVLQGWFKELSKAVQILGDFKRGSWMFLRSFTMFQRSF